MSQSNPEKSGSSTNISASPSEGTTGSTDPEGSKKRRHIALPPEDDTLRYEVRYYRPMPNDNSPKTRQISKPKFFKTLKSFVSELFGKVE